MGFIDSATRGVLPKSQIYIIYGPNGVGKTTLATAFSQSIIADLEDGSNHVTNTTRISANKLKTYDDLLELIKEVKNHAFKTFVLDSVESLESLIQDKIKKDNNVTSIEDIPYGKGMVYTREEFERFMRLMHELRDEKEMNIILVGHSQTKAYSDPNANVTYDRQVLRTNEKVASIIKDLSDSILFLTYKVDTVSQKNKDKVKAYGDGERVIYTQWRPGFDAKSRYALDFEIAFNLDTSTLDEVVNKLLPKNPEDLAQSCRDLLMRISDETRRSEIAARMEKVINNPTKLEQFKQKLLELVK